MAPARSLAGGGTGGGGAVVRRAGRDHLRVLKSHAGVAIDKGIPPVISTISKGHATQFRDVAKFQVTDLEEIRCEMPHPSVRGWTCRGKVYRAIRGTVEVEPRTNGIPPGCVEIVCERCKARYVVCPTKRLAGDTESA